MGRSRAALLATAALLGLGAVAAPAASANTRDNANSYINTRVNFNTVPGAPGYFWANSGTQVWMNCWTQGPTAMGQNKWFSVTVRQPNGYGVTGYVPAPSVSNQWTTSPLCPSWCPRAAAVEGERRSADPPGQRSGARSRRSTAVRATF
ncbi:MAG TPA: hypothetical protein VI248_02210 [Kineosporiaceae bacterium]